MKLEIISREPEIPAQKTPLIFIHGMWHGAWCWEEYFLPYFAKQGYQSYAISLRGHGKSEGKEKLRWTKLSDYVADLAQVINQLKSPPVLIGHSMGGMVVQKYLESYSAPGAVLLASVPPKGLLAATFRVAKRYPLAFLKTNLTLSLYPVIGTVKRCRELLFSPTLPAEKIASYFSLLQNESYRAYLDMMIFNLPRTKLITTPLLVLGASNDKAISPAEVEATAKAYNTTAEFFPNMAHDMMLEPDWQSVAERILSWLNEIVD